MRANIATFARKATSEMRQPRNVWNVNVLEISILTILAIVTGLFFDVCFQNVCFCSFFMFYLFRCFFDKMFVFYVFFLFIYLFFKMLFWYFLNVFFYISFFSMFVSQTNKTNIKFQKHWRMLALHLWYSRIQLRSVQEGLLGLMTYLISN